MMMFGIDEDVAKLFVKNTARFPTDRDVTKAAGIDTLLPGSMVQEYAFEPCGYSMNGLLYDAYWTIHITPESICSYASFETNIRMRDYSSLVKAVLAIFRPRKFTMTLFADEYGLRSIRNTPFQRLVPVPLVESTAKAIAGPCVITTDLHGNTQVTYPGAEAAAAAAAAASSAGGTVCTATTPAQAPLTESAASEVVEPLALEAEEEKKSMGSSETMPAADASGTALVVLDAVGSTAAMDAVNAAADAAAAKDQAASEALAEVASSAAGEALATAPAAVPPHVTAELAAPRLPRFGSKSTMSGARKGAVSYALTAKCATEFVGEYQSFLGNYTLVQAAQNSSHRSALTTVAHAAKEALSNPRAMYVFAKRAEAIANRVRADSL